MAYASCVVSLTHLASATQAAAWKRAGSYPNMSSDGAPSATQLASSRAAPPASIMPAELKPHACHAPRRPGCGPTSGLWSGVNDSGPQTVERIPARSMAGQRLMCPSVFCRKVSQSSSKSPNEKAGSTSSQNSGFAS